VIMDPNGTGYFLRLRATRLSGLQKYESGGIFSWRRRSWLQDTRYEESKSGSTSKGHKLVNQCILEYWAANGSRQVSCRSQQPPLAADAILPSHEASDVISDSFDSWNCHQ